MEREEWQQRVKKEVMFRCRQQFLGFSEKACAELLEKSEWVELMNRDMRLRFPTGEIPHAVAEREQENYVVCIFQEIRPIFMKEKGGQQ